MPSIRDVLWPVGGVLVLAAGTGLGALVAYPRPSAYTAPAPLPPAPHAPEPTTAAAPSPPAPARAVALPHADVPDPASRDRAPDASPPPVGTSRGCPPDAVRVEGAYCPDAQQRCLEWAVGRRRCLRFAEPSRCLRPRREMAFCIDRYEWPNRAGERPTVMVTWVEAEAQCRAVGRRLCTQDEWTFACEGEQMVPYGYGFTRSSDACTVDHLAAAPDHAVLHDLRRDVALAEAARVYEASPSGAMPACVTPFGAYDMPGNVDEWAVNESGYPYRSVLKGGWWGRIRGRCRPATTEHYEHFRYYQIGFRCCADADAETTAGAAAPAPVSPHGAPPATARPR